MRELKDEMKIVLQRILVRLADRIEDLKIIKIEEKFVPNRPVDISIFLMCTLFAALRRDSVQSSSTS